MVAARATKASQLTNSGKARKTHYVDDKSEAIRLAASIAGAQEEKAREKVEKLHKIARSRAEHTPRTPSKSKLQEAKAAIASERARLKKQKFKQRKHNKSLRHSASPPTAPAKRVSFA